LAVFERTILEGKGDSNRDPFDGFIEKRAVYMEDLNASSYSTRYVFLLQLGYVFDHLSDSIATLLRLKTKY
jgi:hypothetical protein